MDIGELKEEIARKTRLSFSRSGGPGGQNVNKRDTKVTAKLVIDELQVPGEAGRARIHRRLSHRLTRDGVLILQSDSERSQNRNREEVLSRLVHLILRVLRPDPRPRKATAPSRASKERRLQGKKRRSDIKKSRGRPIPD